MLDILRRIVQEVSAATNLGQALDIIVARVKQSLEVDVCSVYLVEPGKERLVLMASEGLNAESIGKVQLDFSEGLVGLVAQRAEVINLNNAPSHPRFKYFSETGEEHYHGFLGVPIIHHRILLGVLVVQQREERRFGDDHAAFTITLAAQLAAAISHAEISGDIESLRKETSRPDVLIRGISGAPGVAIGTAHVVYSKANLDVVPDREAKDIKAEVRQFKDAVTQVQQEMLLLKERMGGVLPSEERVLFDAYVMMLSSENLYDRTIELIEAGQWAPAALRDTIRENANVFEEMDDTYLSDRASDIRDLGRRILMHLQQSQTLRTGYGKIPVRTVLIGEDISVTELTDIPPEFLAGIVSERGSASSHVAILARALGVPAVMGVPDLPVSRLDGREVVVDGYSGRVHIQPSEQVKQEFMRLALEEQELTDALKDIATKPAVTLDGIHIPVYVNSGLLADINVMAYTASDGIGLYRTELPFIMRERFPGEEEQYQIYRQVLESVAPRPATLRTLDVGGDKPLPYFPVEEDNPFLGWRGIRIMLDHPELFLTQLRAMLRASVGLNNLQILFPMVSSISEVREAIDLVERAWNELLDEGVYAIMPEMGVMIEVPSAIYLAEPLARLVDFLSVGSNDLVQYLLAVDRNNPRVADLYHSMHPAVLRAMVQIIDAAHCHGKPVSVCGEMASDPAAVALLLGMGVDHLSVSLAGLPRVKWVIGSFSKIQACELLEEALCLEDPLEIRKLYNNALVDAGLGGLVRAGKY